MRISARILATIAVAALLPPPAAAHVKWFAPYDVTQPPLPLRGVLGAHFLLVLAGFLLLVFAGYLADRAVARRGGPPLFQRNEALEERLVRAGTGAFFAALFATGGVILTPELRTEAAWPAWLQGAIALAMFSPRSAWLGAAGILVLYGFAIAEYGLFHLTDYPVFLGIAGYLALTSLGRPRWRVPLLSVSLSASLMWGAVEKWAYPQWSYPVLAAKPYLTLGIPAADFMVIAGFVEFALAFHILTGLGLLRLGIAGLGAIFLAAIVDFGRLDAIGHLPMIMTLAVLFLHGPTPQHQALHRAGRGLLAEGRRAGLGFATALVLFMAAYWGLQRAEYGGGHRVAAMVAR